MSLDSSWQSETRSRSAARSNALLANAESPIRVVVLASEPVVVEPVRVALNVPQVQVRVARDQSESTVALESWNPDLAIVDVDLDSGQALDRLAGRLPVIAVTRARDARLAFDRGAADVLVVPFAADEPLVRVLALGRRARTATVRLAVARSGELEIDLLKRTVRVGDTQIHLTPTQRGLLYLLVGNAERVVTRDEILEALWGTDHEVASNVVDQHVHQLRAKLRAVSRRRLSIVTVPGRGYQFHADDSVESSPSPTPQGPSVRWRHCAVDGLQETGFVTALGPDAAPRAA